MVRNKNIVLAAVALLILVAAGVLTALGLRLRALALSPAAEASPESEEVAEQSATLTPTITPTPRPSDTPAPTPTDSPPTDTPSPTPIPTDTPVPFVPTAAPSNTPTPTETPTPDFGKVNVTIADPTYLAEGRWAEVMVTIRNVSVESGVATGFTYLQPNPGGGTQYVTLFRVDHQEVPQAKIEDGAPLWRGTVQFSDGKTFWFPAGCFYVETVDASGWEPIGGDQGFDWTVHWTGGFFDCGNSTNKIPHTPLIMPGQEATIPIYVYIQHPRLWEDYGPPGRRIVWIGVEVVDGLGRSLGTVGSLSLP
jgi:hypothetical protein